MSQKIETYFIRTDNFPVNIKTMKDKILFIINTEGMIERSSLAIEGLKIRSIQQTVINLREAGLINIHNGYIALSEKGLKRCTEAKDTPIRKIIRAAHVLSFFHANDTIPISSPMICEKLLTEDEEKKRSQITRAIKKLVDDGHIFRCEAGLKQRHYYLTNSDIGQEYLKNHGVVNETPVNPLHLVFQKALPGTLTVSESKPFFC